MVPHPRREHYAGRLNYVPGGLLFPRMSSAHCRENSTRHDEHCAFTLQDPIKATRLSLSLSLSSLQGFGGVYAHTHAVDDNGKMMTCNCVFPSRTIKPPRCLDDFVFCSVPLQCTSPVHQYHNTQDEMAFLFPSCDALVFCCLPRFLPRRRISTRVRFAKAGS